MNQAYSTAVAQGISWINGQMLTFDGGTYGIYERIRIDEHLRTCWVRPDCNTEYLRVLQMQKKRTGSDEFDSLAEKILRWLIKTQDTSPTSIWKGAFPFYVIDGTIRGLANSEAVYQNDNGKILNALCQMYENNPDPRFLAIARPLADYWCSRQRESGLFGMDDSRCVNRVAEGPCFILWPAVGLFRLWKLTKEERYYHCAEKAMTALEQHILPNGRCRTTYEVMHGEDWRPVSSETAMAFYAFGAAYEVTGSDHYRELTERSGAFLLQLQHESGAILNCDESCMDCALQTNPDLADLVYTQGFALQAFNQVYRLTKDPKWHQAAVKLADFLVSIQCSGEFPLWDGGWRGSYNVKTHAWDGRANQNNQIDEGGMYSVYTGWCCTNILYGLQELLETEE